MALARGHGRDPRRILVRHSRDVVRPIPRVLFHESRRAGAAGFLRSSSAISHAVEIEHALFRFHRRAGSVGAGRCHRRNDEHRNIVRVHSRLCRRVDHAGQAPRRGAWFPRSSGSRCLNPRNYYVWSDDLRARFA